MGLFVSTTGVNVVLPELGIVVSHPTTDFEISAQFSAQEIEAADSLTTAITNGDLDWRKTAGGSIEPHLDYDPEYLLVAQANTGGKREDRAVTFGDTLLAKSGRVAGASFSGSPKTATVSFAKPFPDNNYAVALSAQLDGRAWLAESLTAGGFVINAQASAPIAGLVYWSAEYMGESN